MRKQIITTILSFNSVTAEEPAIKTRPQLEQAQTEIKGKISKDDIIIKFKIGKNEEFAEISKSDIKLKQYRLNKKDQLHDKKKLELKEVKSAKELIRIFKKGEDTFVALNFQKSLKYLEKSKKEIFAEIVCTKKGAFSGDLNEIFPDFELNDKKFSNYIEANVFENLKNKFKNCDTILKTLDAKNKFPVCISYIEDLKSAIHKIAFKAKKGIELDRLKDVIKLKQLYPNATELLKVVTATDASFCLNLALQPVKMEVIRMFDDLIVTIKKAEIKFERILKHLELYKKLSDKNFGFAFEVTFKGIKDTKLTKTVLTNYFNIKENKLVEVQKEIANVVDKASLVVSEPIIKHLWLWVFISLVIIAGVRTIIYVKIRRIDEDEKRIEELN